MSEQQPPQEKATSEAAVPPADPPLAAETAPTFEDLAIDDRLGDLERIQKYAHSNIALQRLVHVKMLAETAKAVGFQATVSTLLPILSTLVSDTEFVVRQHLAEQFAEMGRFFVESGGEQGYRLLINSLLPLLSTRGVPDQLPILVQPGISRSVGVRIEMCRHRRDSQRC